MSAECLDKRYLCLHQLLISLRGDCVSLSLASLGETCSRFFITYTIT